jgi:outer membrane protein OmpA-like peptidoglycan-associated protein
MIRHQEKAMRLVLVSGVAAAVLAACVTAPPRSDQLDQARAETATLGQEPLAQQAAAADLEAARNSIQRAEAAQRKGDSPEVVDHYAYLAVRHAQAGEARVNEAVARQEVARAQTERERILLEARTRDANNAQAQALDAQAQAHSAQAQAQNAQAQAELAKDQTLQAQQQLADSQRQLADLQAKKTDRGMVVTLGDVLFDTGQATLKLGSDRVLGRLATFMASNPQTRILIEGHTDSRGSEDYNAGLSERRAQAVSEVLMGKGVPEASVRTVGRGKAYPVATNDTPEGRQQNRRVEIVFSDSSGQFAQGTDRS